jgi:uncharacterized protein (TIGR02302 family)
MFKKQTLLSPEARVSPAERAFHRKVRLSRCALAFERLWPRLWGLIGLAGLFILISLLGVWTALPIEAHWGLLAAFGIAALGALAVIFRVRWPTRDEAIHRLEVRSGVPHRPASTYEDHLSETQNAGYTAAIWQAHQARVRAQLAKLEVGTPQPRTDRTDPIGLRAVLMLAVVTGLALVGDSAADRLNSAFRFSSFADITGARLDAWVTPPPYTSRPPILLADGSSNALPVDPAESRVFEVPEQSNIFVRLGGKSPVELKLEYFDAEGQPVANPEAQNTEQATAAEPGNQNTKPAELRVPRQVKGTLAPGISRVRVTAGGTELAAWSFQIIRDTAPEIEFTKAAEHTHRGAMKLFYMMKDDYGVASAEARLERLPLAPGDPKTSWARTDVLEGARPPLERAPRIVLRIPPLNAKSPETWSFHELGEHPWAGMRVRMTLIARDHAGNVGESSPRELVLPERLFLNPLARAVLEQRRKLVFDPRYSKLVVKALDALTLAPELFTPDKAVYLGLRSVRYRLAQEQTRRSISSAVEQLWHLALRIENGGGLSEAERRLKEIQDKLSKAIERGASDQEIQELMKQLRQALAQFLNELAKQAERMPPQQQPQQPSQQLTQRDLQQMLDNLERMARQGSKQSAQEMLSQLRDLLDRLQSGRMAEQQGQQGQQMTQMMDQFGDIIGKQQRLMDDTFGAQRQDQQGQQGQQGQQQGQQGQQGQRQGRQGQQGRGQEPGGNQPGQLGQRQGELEGQLGRLQEGLRQFGMRPPGQLDGARRSMENARRALEQGDLGRATEEQARALEQLRQGTRSMAEQLRQQMPSSQYGRAQDAPLDPLGRPQRTEGPDLGTTVKVPDEIDAARVREILEELRKRLGERYRPELEREYIERLLERF